MADLFQKINWIDVFVVILLARSGYVGFTKGLGWELFRFSGYIVAILVAIYYYQDTSQAICNYFPALYPISNLLGFTGPYLIILIIFKFINLFIEKIIKVEIFSTLERVGGLLFGLIRGVILLSLLLISLIFTPVPYFEKSIKERSYMGPTLSKIAPFLYEKVARMFPALRFGQRNEALSNLTGLKGTAGTLKGNIK